MPELPIPRHIHEKKISFGKEKDVYEHPNPELVIKEQKGEIEDTPEQKELWHLLSGMEFYLTKILHIIHPENIPDMHMSTTRDGHLQTIHDKVKNIPTPDHFSSDLLNRTHKYIINRIKNSLPNKEQVRIKSEFTTLGVEIDTTNTYNFGKNANNTDTFLDSPYFAKGKKDGLNIRHIIGTDVAKLDEGIDTLPEGNDKIRARKFFNRFLHLLERYEDNNIGDTSI